MHVWFSVGDQIKVRPLASCVRPPTVHEFIRAPSGEWYQVGAIERTMLRMKKVLVSPAAKDKAAAAEKDKSAAAVDKDKAAAAADKDKAAAAAAKDKTSRGMGGSTAQDKASAEKDKAAGAEKNKAAAAETKESAAAETEESAAAATATAPSRGMGGSTARDKAPIPLHERFKNTPIELVQPRHIIQDEVLFRDNCAYTSNIACIRHVRIRAILLIYMNTHRLATMCVYAQYCTYTNVSYTHANARIQTCCDDVRLCSYTCNIVCRRTHCIHAHMRVYKLVV